LSALRLCWRQLVPTCLPYSLVRDVQKLLAAVSSRARFLTRETGLVIGLRTMTTDELNG
jgi:hypothetical protein